MYVLEHKEPNTDLVARGLWTIGAGQKHENRRETVIRANRRQADDPRGQMEFPLLWYRYQLAVRYLNFERWTPAERWQVALGGVMIDNPGGDRFGSMAQALVDTSLVDAVLQKRGQLSIGRDHRSFSIASIGVVDRLAWEDGERTDRGREIDAHIVGTFRSDARAAC